jgi:hypothetical protein
METVFLCLQGGRKFYSVRLNGQEIFVGTQSECDRFRLIHERKVREEREDLLRTPRAKAVAVRTYRQVRA